MPRIPLPPVAQTLKLAFSHSLGDDLNVENVLYAQYAAAGPLTATQVQTAANEAFTAWQAGPLTLMTSSVSFLSVTATDLHTATGFQETSTHAATPGTGTGTTEAAAVALVTGFRTAIRGRSFRGRAYLAGMAEGNRSTPQIWLPGLVTAAETAWTAFNASMAGAALPLTHAVVSYFSGTDATIPGHRPKPIRRVTPLSNPVTLYVVDSRVGSQRRRNA